MTVELRDEPLDGPAAQALLQAFTHDIVERYPTWTPDSGPSAGPQDLAPPAGRFVVAYDADVPVGCAGFKRLSTEIAEVKRMYVAPARRGVGLGRRLLQHLEQAARQAGYVATRLDTGDRQPEALALYRDAGYREIDDYNGNPFATYWFEKEL